MIDEKRLKELMEPGSLRSIADALDSFRKSVPDVDSMRNLKIDTLEAASAVLRKIADPADSADACRDALTEALAFGLAILLRPHHAESADCIVKAVDAFRVTKHRAAALRAVTEESHEKRGNG